MKHLAAIHVLKGKLQLSDDDYRALLANLTGQTSSKALSDAERGRVRDHMQKLAEKLGVAAPRPAGWQKTYREATPMERKVWALWNALGREGRIKNPSPQALRAWVKRQTGMDDLKFCSWPQLSGLIEALKRWEERE
ncbi:MAG: regulatory protein GemA [Burkholderiaceae bacterium]|nr:MAG: regulatory protein GemA [Burkholderiaceae bacterium]